MKIIMQKDSVTGAVTYIYEEEPKELTLEEKQKEEKWHNEFMDSIKIHNQFMHRLLTSFWSLDNIEFNETWDTVFNEYSENKIKNNSENKKDKDIVHDFKSSFIRSFIESMHREENQKSLIKNTFQVHEMWSSQLNENVFILLVWQMNFKEQALLLLENNSCDYSGEIYEHIQQEFIRDFRQRDLPLSLGEKDKILEEEKINFLQIQKTYCTFKKLNDKLTLKNIKSKSNKI